MPLPEPHVFAAVTAALLIGLMVAEATHARAGVWVFKPLASLGFVCTALANGAASTPFGQAVLAGLVLSTAGDILLIPRDKRAFLGGLVAFLLGHVAYAVAFVVRGVAPGAVAAAAVALGIVALVVARWLLPHVEQKMKLPVKAYMTVISAMVALAVGSVVALGGPILLVAAVAFFVSDLAVARDRFVTPGFANRAWGLPLYYGAQLLFALGLHA